MRRSLAVLSALLVIGACSYGGEPPPPAATVPSEVTTSSTAPAPADPAVIPEDLAEIDEDYVQAVVDELFAVDAKATEIFVTTKQVHRRALEYLEAIYIGEELEQQADVWSQTLFKGSETVLPGVLQNDVQRIIDVAADCVFFEVEVDYSETTTRNAPNRTSYLGITPKRPDDDPNGMNPTAWMLFTDGFNPDDSEPENPCEGR